MSIFSYRVFDEVAKTGNFSRAAENLHMTPSAVSHSIASFEEELGFPLFTRGKGIRISMTDEGRVILGYVSEMLRIESYMKEAASDIVGLTRGSVTIGAFTSICTSWIPKIVTSFNEKYPSIKVSVIEADYQDIAAWLRDGTIDIGFQISEEADFNTEFLHKDRFMCVMPPDTKTKRKGSIDIKEIKNKMLICQNMGYSADMDYFMEKYKLDIRPRYFIDDIHSICQLVSSGLGYSILPELMTASITEDVKILPLATEEYRYIYVASLKTKYISPVTKKMYEHIIETICKENDSRP